jgi:hypothetical protein
MDFIIGMFLGMVITAFAVYLIFKYIERQVMAEIEKLTETPEPAASNNVVATVEVVDDRYFCYNKDTSQFICYGSTLAEIVDRFRERFPDRGITLESEDKNITDELYQQYQQYQQLNQPNAQN